MKLVYVLLLQAMMENFTRLSSLVDKTYDNWTIIVPQEVDDGEEIVRRIQVFARPPIILLGTIGNILTFIAMRRDSLKNMSTCFYMAILGLADTGRFHLHPLCCQTEHHYI